MEGAASEVVASEVTAEEATAGVGTAEEATAGLPLAEEATKALDLKPCTFPSTGVWMMTRMMDLKSRFLSVDERKMLCQL